MIKSLSFIAASMAVLGIGLAACSTPTAPAPVAASSSYVAPVVPPQLPASAYYTEPTAAPVAVEPAPLAPARAITDRQWALIAKAPASHVGDRVIVFGKVTQFDAATGTAGFRANVGGVKLPVSYGFVNYPTNTMLTGDEGGLATLVEGDIFRAEVTVIGPYSYDTQIGGSTTVPALTVTAYKVIGHV